MPVVHVVDERKGQRRLISLVFPIRTSPTAKETKRWHWPELHAGKSAIQGFGLFPRHTDALDWTSITERRPVALPYLGKETEVESSVQARVLRTVLCGGFDVVERKELPCPAGQVWVQDGLYVTQISEKEWKQLKPPPAVVDNPSEKLLQVPVEPELSRAITYVEEGDEQVCYLMKEETQKLLHLPEHVFKLLTAHALDEHADRNMATHLVQFTRARGIHLLVSAHPLFRHSAFIMGNANEPPKGSPSLELLELKLVLATDDDPLMQRAGLKQDPISLKMFDVFEDEHPEILMRSTFFVTRKEGSCFKEAEELTVVYGNQYKRTYSTWGHAGTPLRYHVPHDQWAEGVWENWSQYPERCPGWFNPDQQPLNRPVFARVPNSDHEVTILPDLPAVVAARKLGLDGDAAAQRLAKLEQLIWPRQLPLLPEQEAEPADGGKKNVKRPAKASSSAEAGENPFVPFQVPVMERFAAGALTAFYDWPKRSLLDSGGPPTEVIPQAQTRRVGGVPTFPRLVPRMADASTLSAPPPEDDQASGKTGPPSSASALRGLPAIEQFELPSVLQNINRDELGRLVKAEECIRAREDHGLEDGLPELTELDWNSPWRFPLGSIVWCKMAGYPCWPAEVCSPAVNDQDIARQRCEGEVFVRFFGWAHSKNDYLYAPAETLMTWEEGVERGLLASKHSKKATDDTLQMAKVEALAALRARPQPPPVEPPPWWEPTEGGSRAVAYKSHGRGVKAGVKGGATTKTPVSPKKATKRKEPPETPKPSRGGTRRDPTSEASSLTSLFNMETPDSRKGKKPKVAPTPPAAKMTGLFQARKPGNRPSPRSK